MKAPSTFLKEQYHPMFDTLSVWPSIETFQVDLFQNHMKFPDGTLKTQRDTNMWSDGQLGLPNEAEWHWLRVMFTRWPDIEKAQQFCAETVIELSVGMNHPVAGPIVLSAMNPILPSVSEIPASQHEDQVHLIILGLMRRQLEKKEMKFWPWLELPLRPGIRLESSQNFRVRVSSPNKPMVAGIVAKVVLGPTLFVAP